MAEKHPLGDLKEEIIHLRAEKRKIQEENWFIETAVENVEQLIGDQEARSMVLTIESRRLQRKINEKMAEQEKKQKQEEKDGGKSDKLVVSAATEAATGNPAIPGVGSVIQSLRNGNNCGAPTMQLAIHPRAAAAASTITVSQLGEDLATTTSGFGFVQQNGRVQGSESSSRQPDDNSQQGGSDFGQSTRIRTVGRRIRPCTGSQNGNGPSAGPSQGGMTPPCSGQGVGPAIDMHRVLPNPRNVSGAVANEGGEAGGESGGCDCRLCGGQFQSDVDLSVHLATVHAKRPREQ